MNNNFKDFDDFYSTYKIIGNENIEKLYCFSCLKYSGFDDIKAYNLIPILKEMWMDDINNNCISLLSDILYEYCKNNKIKINDINNLSVDNILLSEEYEQGI